VSVWEYSNKQISRTHDFDRGRCTFMNCKRMKHVGLVCQIENLIFTSLTTRVGVATKTQPYCSPRRRPLEPMGHPPRQEKKIGQRMMPESRVTRLSELYNVRRVHWAHWTDDANLRLWYVPPQAPASVHREGSRHPSIRSISTSTGLERMEINMPLLTNEFLIGKERRRILKRVRREMYVLFDGANH
jgi:hypothetical protein